MSDLLERGIYPRVLELLGAVPVVVLEGPRASGRTAIGAMLSERDAIRTVVDLSDPTVRRAVESAQAPLSIRSQRRRSSTKRN